MTESEIAERYEAARRIGRAAGELALDYFRNRDRLAVEVKGVSDYVSQADRDGPRDNSPASDAIC